MGFLMLEEEKVQVIQPAEVFDLLGIKNSEEAHKILNFLVSFINYMSVGTELHVSCIKMTKISRDLIHINPEIDFSEVVDSLNKSMTLKIPT